MRIREAKDLSPSFIGKAITAHAGRVAEEARRGVGLGHRLRHVNRIRVLAHVALGSVAAVNNRTQRIAILGGK